MAHYAFLDENNIVTEVISGKDENELLEGLTPEEWYGKFRDQRCVRTSYNGNIRKNYASVGGYYDEERDAFIPRKIYNFWILNEDTCQWEFPVEYPTDDKIYTWNDNQGLWEEVLDDN
jgi:hypothetical protein